MTLQVIWKIFICDIPTPIAQTLSFLGMEVCCFNIILIFTALSIIRILIYHKCNWFTVLDKHLVSRAVLITSLGMVFATKILNMLIKTGSPPSYFVYAIYLPSELTPLLDVLFPVTTSLLLEIYISIRLKKLPWLSLKSVTMGHLLMAIVLLVIVNNQQNNVQFKSIQMALVLLGCQMLYIYLKI